MDQYDLAIAGYGPTGLMLASLVAQTGHKVLVLERWPQLYGRARLTHIDGETARLLGFACDRDHALRDASTIHSFKFLNARGGELLDVATVPSTPMGHAAHISIFQPHIEDALDERVKSCPNATVLQGWEVTKLTPDHDHVTLEFANKDGEARTATAKYVFGADGARSFVRQAVGIEQDDAGFNERWLNVDGSYDGKLDPMYDEVVQHCDPARGRMTLPIGTSRRRFEFGLRPSEKTEEMETDETVAALLKKYFNADFSRLTVSRKVVYQFECRSAKIWRAGRVLLGGDAAHTMPPYLGQGACSGIRDATNLAWKIDLVLRGQAPDSLLDTYEPERKPHVTHIQKAALGFGKVANTHSKIAAALRDLAFKLKLTPSPPSFPPLGPGVKQNAAGKSYARAVGEVPPHGKVELDGARQWFDDVTDYRFKIVAIDGVLADIDPSRRAFLRDLDCRLYSLGESKDPDITAIKDVDGRMDGFLSKHKCAAMILRPDTNLFGLAEDGRALNPLIDELRDTLGWRAYARKGA